MIWWLMYFMGKPIFYLSLSLNGTMGFEWNVDVGISIGMSWIGVLWVMISVCISPLIPPSGHFYANFVLPWSCPEMIILSRFTPQYLYCIHQFYCKLHFKALVTSSGHLSDKIFISSHFMKNLKTHPCNMAYMLYFQKIVGFY